MADDSWYENQNSIFENASIMVMMNIGFSKSNMGDDKHRISKTASATVMINSGLSKMHQSRWWWTVDFGTVIWEYFFFFFFENNLFMVEEEFFGVSDHFTLLNLELKVSQECI